MTSLRCCWLHGKYAYVAMRKLKDQNDFSQRHSTVCGFGMVSNVFHHLERKAINFFLKRNVFVNVIANARRSLDHTIVCY